MAVLTPEILAAYAERRRLSGGGFVPLAPRSPPRVAPPPRTGQRRSMIGYRDDKVIDGYVRIAVRDGSRDPVTASAILNDPRVREVLRDVGSRAVALGDERRRLSAVDSAASSTLGWRVWRWDDVNKVLRSPEKLKAAPIDPRDPDHSRPGIFATHNCWKCKDGTDLSRCPTPDRPGNCGYPHGRND